MIGIGKMYVLVNKDLKMSRGKIAAQVAHAVARVDVPAPRTVIVLRASTEQLHNLDTYLERMNLPHHLYIDEGMNEVPAMSATALAVGNYADDYRPDYMEGFLLLNDPKWMERWMDGN